MGGTATTAPRHNPPATPRSPAGPCDRQQPHQPASDQTAAPRPQGETSVVDHLFWRRSNAHSIWSDLSILLPGLTSQSPPSLASIFQGHGGIPKCSAPGIGQAERCVWRVTGCKPGQAPDIVHAPLWFLCDGSALSQVQRRPATPCRCRNCLNSCGCPGISWRAQGQHWRMEELNVLGL